jgi:predicted nucleic acid-binding protein
MNIVDSSCWLEYLAGSKVGDVVSPIVENTAELIVPSITIYEVFKKICRDINEDQALFVVAQMKQGQVVDMDSDMATYSGKIGLQYSLAMADSIIYATTLKYNAILYTQDKHFKDFKRVVYYKKEEDL